MNHKDNTSAVQAWSTSDRSFGSHANVSLEQHRRLKVTEIRPPQVSSGLSLYRRQHCRLDPPSQLPLPNPQLPLPLQGLGRSHDRSQALAPPMFVQPHNAQQASHYDLSFRVMAPQSLSSPASQSEDRRLPLPKTILQSQSTETGPCLACGRLECNLASHRSFSKHVLENTHREEPQVESGGTKTPPSSTAVPVPANSTPSNAVQVQLPLDPEREHLLNLWSHPWSLTKNARAHTLESHLFPSSFIDRVLPAARAHAPLLHAVLAYSGTLCAIAHKEISDMAKRQQAFAIQLLTRACPTEQDASTDEAMLAATLLLLVYMAQGNGLETQKHVSGLIRLVAVRGGLHYLGLAGLVSDMLTYADVMQAIFFNTEPVWTLPLPPLDIGPPAKMGRGFRNMLGRSKDIDPSLMLAAQSVCKVAGIFQRAEEHLNNTPPKQAMNGLSYLSMITPYQLAKCNAVYHNTGTVDECVCLALILLHHVVLRSEGTITPAIRQVEHQLWQALEQAENKGPMPGVAPRLYAWVCFMGATVSVLLADGEWTESTSLAVQKLGQVRTIAGVIGWESVRRDILEDFCWVGVVQEEVFRRIWAVVEHCERPGIQDNGITRLPATKLNLLPPAG